MKNTLFLDADFHPELLENEESDADAVRNTIYLRFKTTAALNQKLQIYVGAAFYEVPVASSVDITYQLPGQFWAQGNVTRIRLANDSFTSDDVYISFPEIISADAALQEVDGGNQEYYLQGKTTEAQELRSETAVYRNGRDYYITTLTRIVQFVFASRQANTTGLLTLTLTVTCSGITDEALVRFHLRTNLVMDEVFIPTQTVKNGKYIITICYPAENIAQSDRNSIDVFVEISDGEMELLQGNAIATLTGSGILGSSKFTGLIEVIDITAPMAIPEIETVEAPLIQIQIDHQIPIGASVSDETIDLQIADIISSDTLTERVQIINYGAAEPRVLEDGTTLRVTEDGQQRVTEQEA